MIEMFTFEVTGLLSIVTEGDTYEERKKSAIDQLLGMEFGQIIITGWELEDAEPGGDNEENEK